MILFNKILTELLDDSNKGYRYGKILLQTLKKVLATSYKEWLKDMNNYRVKQRAYSNVNKYDMMNI